MNSQNRKSLAYRIETERLVIRCWQPTDAQMLKEAMDMSLEHLRPFFPLAEGEPLPLDERINKLRKARGQFDMDEYHSYGIFNPSEDRVIGWISLSYLSQTLSHWIRILTGSTALYERIFGNILKFGVWIRVDEINKGYATESVGALVKIAFELYHAEKTIYQFERGNAGSAAVTAKLGFTKIHSWTWYKPKEHMATNILMKANYPSSRAAQMSIKVYDAVGQLIL